MGVSFSDVGYGKTDLKANAACASSIKIRGYDVIYPLGTDYRKMKIEHYGVYYFENVKSNDTYGAKSVWMSHN